MIGIDALPAVVLGVITYAVLPDRPEQAAWLTAEERGWLAHRLAHEKATRESVRRYGVWEAMRNGRVLAAAASEPGLHARLEHAYMGTAGEVAS